MGDFVDNQLQEYLDNLLPQMGGALGEIQRGAYDEGLPIILPHVVSLLSTLLAAIRPRRVLEIGCGVGFSTGLLSQHLGENGHLTTIERYDYMLGRAEENFAKLGITEKVRIIREDAAVALPRLANDGESFDFIFMDCGKSRYLHFLPYCMEMLAPCGMLAVDDVLQSGTVAWEFENIVKRQRTTYRNMREFLQATMAADGFKSSILPIGDGLLLCVKSG